MLTTERAAEWKKANPERAAEHAHRWYRANRGQQIERSIAWKQEHREQANASERKRYAANPEKKIKRLQDWRKANPEKNAARAHRYLALLTGNGGSFTAAEWIALKEEYSGRCAHCLLPETELSRRGRLLSPDHVLPISKGGRNEIANIQPLCHGRGGCNNRKYAKHEDWRPSFRQRMQVCYIV